MASELGTSFSKQPSDLADRAHWGSFVFVPMPQARWGGGYSISSVCLSLEPPTGREIQLREPELQGPGSLENWRSVSVAQHGFDYPKPHVLLTVQEAFLCQSEVPSPLSTGL